MIRRPPRSTQSRSSAASDVYKRQSILTVSGFDVKEEDDNDHDDHTRAVHVAVPEPGLPADRQLLPGQDGRGRPSADLPASGRRPAAADAGNGGRSGGAQPRGGTPSGLRTR